jgi:signal transduction histidine kinase
MTYLGNSINIAGKNRFLTSNLMLEISEYLLTEDNTKSSSKINAAINQLESNILTLRQGGNIVTGIDLKPLPREFLDDWNKIYQKWISIKTNLVNKIIKSTNELTNSETSIDKEASLLETEALALIDSSNLLVMKLSDYLKSNSEYSLFIQQIFTILIIVVTAAFAFYISNEILKPILSLTSTISEINGEKLNVIISQNKRNNNNKKNELSILSNSFNYMLNSIKNIKNQDKLINELKKANEELKYKDQLKNDFINVAAHEMKTPIQPIISVAELLRQEGMNQIEKVKEKELLDIIYRNAKRLMQLAEDVLDVTRIETGSFFLNKEKFNVKEMVTDILREYEQKIVESNKKNIKLSYEIHHNDNNNNDGIIIEGDRNRLSQVVYNLLNNAIKFTNEGSITVIVDERKKGNNDYDEILISIKDTGIGIHPEILPKLFTKFATKSLRGGTGLGLFISKKIIELHGGKIWATNNKECVGSTFTFSLPAK